MHWIIQNNILNEDGHNDLVQALEILEIPHSIHKIIPFTTELHPKAEPKDPKVICMGSYSLLRVSRANNWTPGVFDLQNITHLDLREIWGERMLNQGTQIPFKEVPNTQEFKTGAFFLRPATDEKFFAGKAFETEEFLPWWTATVINREDYGTGLTPETPVLISPLKTIHSEFRTWIVEGKVVTASSYKFDGTLNTNLPVDNDIIAYAQDCAQIWCPKTAFCLDIGRTPKGLKIVEPNTINFAGFYKANVFKIIEAIESLTL